MIYKEEGKPNEIKCSAQKNKVIFIYRIRKSNIKRSVSGRLKRVGVDIFMLGCYMKRGGCYMIQYYTDKTWKNKMAGFKQKLLTKQIRDLYVLICY